MKKILAVAALLTAAMACEPPARTIEPGISPVSGEILVTRDNNSILIADQDRGQLLVIDRVTKEITGRVPVGEGPGHVIELSNGRAAVTTRYGNSVVVVDVAGQRVDSTILVGAEPYGLVEIAPGKIAVALAGDQALAVVDLVAGVVAQKVQLADADPRAVALLEDGSLYVTHMATGNMSRVNLDSGSARLVNVNTRNDFGPRIVSEHMRSITVDPSRGSVLVAHSVANPDTVRAGLTDDGFDDGSCGGYGGCPEELPAVTPTETEVIVSTDVVSINNRDDGSQNGGAFPGDCFDCGFGFGSFSPNPPSVLNPNEQRFVGTQIANPTALALFDGGRGKIIVNLGSKNALLLRRDLNGTASDVIATVKVGNGAQSIALSQDGTAAYVWNAFDLTLSEIELPMVDSDLDTQSKFVPDAAGRPVASAELGIVPEIAARTHELGLEEVLSVEAAIGRRMFHDATDSRIASAGAVSCASCHPDGRNDGRTWQFVFGPRNTPQLGGDILDTAPFHWPGDVPTVAALNDMTVLPFMGGTGLDPASFQFIAAFIGTIKAAPSAVAARGINELEARGEEIFFSEATGCATCHSGAHFTNNIAYNVGTRSQVGLAGSDIDTFQTPVLHGLNRSAPYLHDGSAATLEDLVENVVATDKMGKGSHLSSEDKQALVAYLKTL